MIKRLLYIQSILLLLFLSNSVVAQNEFSRLDSLRGSITPEREWWDLSYYHLDISVEPDKKYLSGSVTIQYKVLSEFQKMQIDLQEPLRVTRIVQKGKELSFRKFGPVHSVELKQKQKIGAINEVIVYYDGFPKEARMAPWDGGLSWKKDKNGNDFVATSCQGLGASIWWPCKDHMYDEVDSMLISVEVPEHLIDVSNGRLRAIDENKERKTKTYHWYVANPINNYGVNINIGDYIHWNEKYEGEKGELDLDYWVLSYNEDAAREQFKQGRKTIEAFEHWFGPYPFYEDGYKLVEVPYLGMEHQSSVTYGNKFKNGYLGKDHSYTGWGLMFDYIIIHESGHEWFANNITYKDEADMWIHESFTTYSESLYLDYWIGKEASEEYNRGLRRGIGNNGTMIGPYDVNRSGSDVYDKGATLLGMIRQIINDDEKWRMILRGLGEEFYHQTVKTAQIENYISDRSGIDFSSIFDQYLRTTQIPILEYYFSKELFYYRWTGVVDDFSMPVDINIADEAFRITPLSKWQSLTVKGDELNIQLNYYISSMKLQ